MEHANVSLMTKLRTCMFLGWFNLDNQCLGIKSHVNRSDAGVDYYYSGYFYDTGTEGTTKDFMQMKEQEDQSMLPSIFTTAIITLNPNVVVADLPIRKVLLNPQGHIRVLL